MGIFKKPSFIRNCTILSQCKAFSKNILCIKHARIISMHATTVNAKRERYMSIACSNVDCKEHTHMLVMVQKLSFTLQQ